MNKKRVLLTSAAILGVVVATSGIASAHFGGQHGDGQMAEAFAKKFNLNQAEVQKFFTEQISTHHQQRLDQIKMKVGQAVKEGKISQSLADQLISKITEIDNLQTSLISQGKSHDEIKQIMKGKQEELKKWLKDNGISKGIIGDQVLSGRHRKAHK